MASNSNVTGVHISLIVFVMFTLILGVLTFLGFKDLGEKNQQLASTKQELDEKTRANTNLDAEVQALKQLIGHEDAVVGVGEPGADTVIGKGRTDLTNVAQQGATQPDYRNALADMANRYITTLQLANGNQSTINDEQRERARQKSEYEQKLKEAIDAQRAAEAHRDQIESSLKEMLDSKNQELAALDQKHRQLLADYQQDKETWTQKENQFNQDIAQLTLANDQMWERINELEKVSFEKEDGIIHWVDHRSGLVWLNLGSEDHLPVRLSLSVYTKTHHGVGRGRDDIKGSIEITRILGPHLAQARILEKNSFNPITQGDPVYTPLWSPGRIESFAVVGVLDFDGDGKSDREIFKDLVTTAGARITTAVDDEGNRTGSPISVNTKFLVVGEQPDPTVADEDQRAKNLRILEHFTEMQKEARIQGVRKISLSDFLSHIGYKPKRRFWAPGMEIPWKLKSGAQSASVDETIGDRASSGQVSGAFGKRLLKPESSTGKTSKIFRGSNGGY